MHTPTFKPYNLRALNGRKIVAKEPSPNVAADVSKVAEVVAEPIKPVDIETKPGTYSTIGG